MSQKCSTSSLKISSILLHVEAVRLGLCGGMVLLIAQHKHKYGIWFSPSLSLMHTINHWTHAVLVHSHIIGTAPCVAFRSLKFIFRGPQ